MWVTSVVLLAVVHISSVHSQIASLPFQDCSSSSTAASTANRINISTIYAQITNPGSRARFLNLTLLGLSGAVILDVSNTSQPLLSTVAAPTQVLTFTLNPDAQSHFAFCQTLRPPSPLPPISNVSSSGFCPISAGPIGFSAATSLSRSFDLMTLNTQIRVLDTSDPAQELACVNVAATPLSSHSDGSFYGHAIIVFWTSVSLALGYWLVIGIGRLAAAWKRGRQRVHDNIWSHIQGVGFVLASAISGERFASSPALMRFGTPSMRDVIFHTQWCALLGMVAVQWPRFAYPYFAQTAWATLLYNVSLTQGSDSASKHWYPLHTDPFNPPVEFADQIADPTSPLYLDRTIANTLFTFPDGVPQTGIPALAVTVGIRPQDAFNNALALFVLILSGTILLSVLIFGVDWLLGSVLRVKERSVTETRTPSWANKEFGASPELALGHDELVSTGVRFQPRSTSRTLRELPTRRGWLSYRLGQSSFHGSVLHGNLIRILILFHLPVTILACYQFSSGKLESSLAAVVIAVFAFAVFSILIPAFLVYRLSTTPTNKLYDETSTLLALGPLYNHYAQGSQLFTSLFFATNIVYGVSLGCGQQSGTAQSIIILVVEVASALTTSVWLPWGRGATMGTVSFIFCVARIITAVLLVILSPAVSVGDAAGGWIAYAILVIQGLVYLGFFLMLIFKILEGLIRLTWDISFDHSKHTVDSGLFGAIGLAGRRRRARARKMQERPPRSSRAESDLTTHNMLPPAMQVAAHSRTTVSTPPSVLRPEQLTQPYREESDDESGYILGAWHYDDEYTEPSTAFSPPAPPTSPPQQSSSGFSRVAGGRANINSPYTMAAGGSAFANSPGVNSFASSLRGSTAPGSSALPPGAMAPGHIPPIRRKSQSAIIEDAAPLCDGVKGKAPISPSESSTHDEDTPRRKNWLSRALFSDGNATRPRRRPPSNDPPDLTGSPESTSAPRTFVVIRERKPSPLSQAQLPDEPEGNEEGTRSFAVIRP
ncbi:hypothetical protein BU17DRAFT_36849 [Hysterangium stoloniferum]|nr:hypothetical protein BU17DRAFT_36849 [Hysterangium stoloniferum]